MIEEEILTQPEVVSRLSIQGPSQRYLSHFVTSKGQVFGKYWEFQEAELKSFPDWRKPFLRFKFDCERATERYFEEKHSLPVGHLRGLVNKRPNGMRLSRFAKIIANDFKSKELELTIHEIVKSENELCLQAIQEANDLFEERILEVKQAVDRDLSPHYYQKAIHETKKLSVHLSIIYEDLNSKLELLAKLIANEPDDQIPNQ